MNRILIVPGLRNSGAGHWQTEWEKRLPNVARIELSDWETPNLTAWVDATKRAIAQFEPTHIVAHSFGTLATAVIAAEGAGDLRGLLLVAPADPDKFDIRNRLPNSRLAVRGVLVGSLSDPWLSWPKAQILSNQWGLDIECAGDAGHINVHSGHGHWPDGWKILQRLVRTTSPIDLSRDFSLWPAPTATTLPINY